MKEDIVILFLTIYRGLIPFFKHSRGDILFEHLETEKEMTHRPSRKMGKSHEQRQFAKREVQIKSTSDLVDWQKVLTFIHTLCCSKIVGKQTLIYYWPECYIKRSLRTGI